LEEIQFEQGEISLFGKKHSIPRLESFHAKNNLTYSYSGKSLNAKPFTAEMFSLCERIENAVNSKFNCVLINYYRNGMDSNGWHADNEKELGENPVIASLSLGETRRFDLKHQFEDEKFSIPLNSGDLLLMDNQIQNFYKHQIAKSKKINNPRINLTFRWIY
jgi:alkylated DNA repair dioxygenase AlkB